MNELLSVSQREKKEVGGKKWKANKEIIIKWFEVLNWIVLLTMKKENNKFNNKNIESGKLKKENNLFRRN